MWQHGGGKTAIAGLSVVWEAYHGCSVLLGATVIMGSLESQSVDVLAPLEGVGTMVDE